MNEFILGIIFIVVIIPILEGLVSLTLTFLEGLKSMLGVIISKNNKVIEYKPNKNPIGFAATEEEQNDL